MPSDEFYALDSHERSHLIHALQVSKDRFLENRREMMRLHHNGGNPLVTAQAAKEMAETFKQYAEENDSLIEKLERAYSVHLLTDPKP